MRAFLGLPIPQSWSEAVETALAPLKRDSRWAGEKWVPSRNLHVTVAFFGELDHHVADDLVGRLDVALGALGPVLLEPRGIVLAPHRRNPTMLWLSLRDVNGGFALVSDAVRSVMEDVGIRSDPRTQTPHVTLVRTRRPMRGASLMPAVSDLGPVAAMSQHECILFSSDISGMVPHYDEVRRFGLSGGG